MTIRSPLARRFYLAFAATVAAALPAQAQAPGTFNGLNVEGDQPIAIESDQLDVDDAKALATFTGNVAVSQGETLIKTSKLLVYYVKAPAADSKAPAAPKPDAAKGALPGGTTRSTGSRRAARSTSSRPTRWRPPIPPIST